MDQYGNVSQPIFIPETLSSVKTQIFHPMIGHPRSCFIDIIGETYLSAGRYSVDCSYTEDNTVEDFYITFYNTIPTPATLKYSLY